MTESNSSIEATDSHLGRNLSVEPTSPINSNSSSVDTLKFPDQCHLTFHLCLEPTSSRPITLPLTLCIASAPTHPMPTTGFAVPLAEYALRTGISSIGMTTCVTSEVSTVSLSVAGLQEVRWLETIVCRRLLTCFSALSTTITLRFCRSRDGNIRWAAAPARRGISPRATSALGSHIRCVIFALHAHTL